MTPMQQILLGVGGKKKVYMDEVFSTYVYKGTGSAQSVNNGINLSESGGMTWIKKRDGAERNVIIDSARGLTKSMFTERTDGDDTNSDRITSLNTNGFTLGDDSRVNNSNGNYAAWTFRKAPGFLDIVTYTGTGNNPNADSHLDINHQLGSVPGMMIVKKTSGTSNWWVYHRGLDSAAKAGFLQSPSAAGSHSSYWNGTAPTASQFTVGEWLNVSGSTYVAYLFGGGQSTSSEARSVEFDGASDHMRLSLAASTDLDMGTGDFTIEFWYKGKNTTSSSRQAIIASNTTWQSGFTQIQVNHPSHINHVVLWDYDINSSNPVIKSTNAFPSNGTWRHVALARSSGTLRLFVNGTLENSVSQSGSLDFSDGNGTLIGYNPSDTGLIANISNLRVVKGTALYTTSSFTPPTKPLTNITNTKLLCCNNSSTTGSTVTPGTITAHASPIARSEAPFDDPAGLVFGGSGDQGIIKCGSYKGTGNAHEVDLGFEPQYILFKDVDASENWNIYDSMRGIDTNTTSNGDKALYANSNTTETGGDAIQLTQRGFEFSTGSGGWNANTRTHVYMAIRRPDPLVAIERTASELFTMDTGNSSSTIPTFDSTFPIDFALMRNLGTTEHWYTGARLTGPKYMSTDRYAAENGGNEANWVFDSNTGWCKNYNSNYQSWMWRRSSGFDVVATRPGTGSGTVVRHNLGRNPEMIWAKKRITSNWGDNSSNNYILDNWWVWHNNAGNSDAYKQAGWLNKIDARGQYTMLGSNNAVFDTHVEFASNVTYSGDQNLMLFFASVEGISKCGVYTGDGGTSNAVTCGFQPRFLITKKVNNTSHWKVYDSVRGTQRLRLNEDSPQTNDALVSFTSTGFTLVSPDGTMNGNGDTYIFYAHA